MDTTMHEHASMIDDLFMPHMATHKAINDGDWSDPSTWEGGKVPDAGADVYIPAGVSVTYDVYSNVELDFVRVDGTLTWDREADTKMMVDTILTAEGSELEIGSMHGAGGTGDATPIEAGYTAEIVFVDGQIDASHDPELLTRGLVAWGHVDIMGAEKEPFLSIEGGATAGSKSITVSGDLTNWEIGDTIVLIGTEYVGEDADGVLKTQDEERTIVAIDGDKIIFDKALSYDHTTPAGYDVDTYVANSSRNVVFSSENPEGVRGHMMLMNNEVDHGDFANSVINAEFDEMGRTDKNEAEDADNPIGRYPIHLHMTGSGDSAMSMISGNAVSGSPGWGIVQHDSNAMIMDNFVHDVTGAGIVSELGNEQGAWVRNLVSNVYGAEDGADSGSGAEGIAYENQSRVIIQQDNIAANSKIGWNWEGDEIFDEGSTVDGIHRKMFERYEIQYDPSPFDEAIDHEEPAITHFTGNESIANEVGFQVFHRQYSDDTDTMSVISDFTVWGGVDAVNLKNYASNYLFMDSLWIGEGTAVRIERKTSSVVLNDVDLVDFGTGWRSYGVNHESFLIDVTYTNVGTKFVLQDLLEKVDSTALQNELIKYYDLYHDIDYTNPMPTIVNSKNLTPVDEVVFIPDSDADLTLGPGDYSLNITGITIDSVGVRNFNEYVIARTPSGSGNSKDFEGVKVSLTSGGEIQKNFTLDEFLEVHGTLQKADGSWVVPVVNWVTDRLTGDQHPVIIEIDVNAFDESYLKKYELTDWQEPTINNTDFDYGFDFETGTSTNTDNSGSGQDQTDTGSGTDTGSDTGSGTDAGGDTGATDEVTDDDIVNETTDVVDDPEPVADAGNHIVINGGNNAEKLVGSEADEWMNGLGGSDTIRGQAGDDRLDGGAGADVLSGGEGADIFVLSHADGNSDNISDFSVAEGDVIDLRGLIGGDVFTQDSTLDSFVRLDAQSKRSYLLVDVDGGGDDFVRVASLPGVTDLDLDALYEAGQLLIGEDTSAGDNTNDQGGSDEPANVYYGDNAADSIRTTDSNDIIYGFKGDDVLIAYGGDDFVRAGGGNDLVRGNSGDDTLSGQGGNDTIYGGGGKDHIFGSTGSDTMTGGAGADVFEFRDGSVGKGVDLITDFSIEQGDQLALRNMFDGHTDDTLDEFIQVVQQSGSSVISVDLDGGGNDFVQLAVLEGTQVTLAELHDNGSLIC